MRAGKGAARFMHEDTLRKLHSFTGLFPLGAYLLFHAYEQLPVRQGRDAAILRLTRTTYAPLEVLCVLLPLLLHAALGVRLARERARRVRASGEAGAYPYASSSFARLQMWSGVVSACFLLWHVATVWLPRVSAARAAAGYGAMVEQVATVPRAALYVIGTTAVCVHFGQGVSALLMRYGVAGITPSGARLLGALIAGALWLTFVDELSAFVAGAALL